MIKPAEHMDTNPAAVAIEAEIRRRLASSERRPLLVGLCGAQGSGKSTLATALKARLDSEIRTSILSLDDLYLTGRERENLAARIHPLFRTRGVPGTHDIALGLGVIAGLEQGKATSLPRFDKARDDRLPPQCWDKSAPGTDVLILEGWCVGARPQSAGDLLAPVNGLEAREDRDGLWRTHANTVLAGDYQELFGRVDLLVFLAAPDFGVVKGWRTEQEHRLISEVGRGASNVMSDSELARFVQHYERLTKHMLVEMRGRADVVVELEADRSIASILIGRD